MKTPTLKGKVVVKGDQEVVRDAYCTALKEVFPTLQIEPKPKEKEDKAKPDEYTELLKIAP
ncbi:conserved hypothetical protein [Ricinus communis]|uniref:Uncharacterized protein n=1 Tax=Ricinus communis TaxID=3988 RepID=B9RU52_RICCO|nr:conserved hypothetical protein [Ricinus communis]